MYRRAGLRALACTSVLALLGTVVGPVADATPTPEVAPSASPSHVDVDNPEDGITDPAAGVEVLDRNCADGQTDVNTAAAGEIAAAFGLASLPTVDRIIEGRPWLTPGDLVSVPGVGPEREPILAANGCATPLTLPEEAPLACTSDDQVDLQVASATQISKKAKLPMVAANAIVAHRPVPQDLTQLVAPRTPGLDVDKVAGLVAAERVCVTPVPFTYVGTDWRWIYPAKGGVVESSHDSNYALIVPPGTVTDSTFGKVTPVLEEPLPTADFHLYRPFTGEVAVRLPDFGAGDPVLLHQAAGGLSVSWGRSTAAEPGGTVVGPVKSLSEVSSSGLQAFCNRDLLAGYSMNVFCMDESPRDLPIIELIEKAGRVTGERRAAYRSSGECATAGDVRLIVDGSTPPGLLCSATVNAANQTKSTWTFNNVLAGAIVEGFIESFGGVYNVKITEGVSPVATYSTSPGPEDSGVVSGLVARALADLGVLVPGTARNFVKPQGEAPTVTTAFVEGPATASMFYAIFQSLGIADAASALAQRQSPAAGIVECAGKAVDAANGNGSTGAAIECFEAAITVGLQVNAEIADEAGDAASAAKLRGYAEGLSKFSFALQLTNYGSSMITSILAGGGLNDQSMKFQYLFPPPAAGGGSGGGGDGSGGSATASAIGLDGTGNFIARTSTGDGFLVYPTGTAYRIKDGGDFLCYARRLAVVDYVQYFTVGSNAYLNLGPDVAVESSDAPDCSIVPFRIWDYEPPPQGNTPYNVILRGQFDGTKHPSWLINNRGEIQTIPDGNTYICLAATNPVIWDVPFSEIQEWRPVGTEPASCG
jgi:hypothetical protein